MNPTPRRRAASSGARANPKSESVLTSERERIQAALGTDVLDANLQELRQLMRHSDFDDHQRGLAISAYARAWEAARRAAGYYPPETTRRIGTS